MKFNETAFRRGVKATLASLAVGTASISYAQQAADTTKLEAVEVTGSRIKRTDAESSLPVTVLKREQFQAQGYETVADVLRNTTFNSFGSFTTVSGSSGQGASQASLRGLGANRTLVLIDGHRISNSPILGASGADLNTVPLAAVERIEILTDGASAIYGSDAIGGVINIITRKNFNGAEITGGVSKAEQNGGDTQDLSFVGGVSKGSDRLLFGAAYTNKDAIYLRDRDYTKAKKGDGVNFSTTSGLSGYGNTVFRLSDFSPLPVVPGSCSQPGFAIYTDDKGQFSGTPGSQLCTFDFTAIAADTTSLRTSSLFSTYTHDIDENWQFTARGNYTRVESFGRFAPAAAGLIVSASAPSNPYGTDIYVTHRYAPLGPRDNDTNSDVFTFLSKVDGKIGNANIELGADYSRNTFDNFGSGYPLTNVVAGFATTGAYNPFNLANAGTAQTIAASTVTTSRQSLDDYREAFGNISFGIFTLPGGDVTNSLGAEYRSERFFDKYDSQSEAGTVGGSSGNSSAGDRSAYAVYDEILFPVLKNLEVDIAGRFDDYDDVGSKFVPKASIKYTPFSALSFRGSAGKGFRAPELSVLHASNTFSAESAKDFTQCRSTGVSDAACPSQQFNTFFVSNDQLKPETSTQYGAGFVVQPADWFDGSLDYYNIKIKGSIDTPSVQSEIIREANGQPLTQGATISRTNPARPVFTIQTVNLSSISTNGLDLNLHSRFKFGRYGSLEPSFQWSYVIDYESDDGAIPPQNIAGFAGTPRYKMQGALAYKLKPITLFWNVAYTPSTAASTVTDPNNVLKDLAVGHVSSYAIHDVQAKYDTPWKSSVAVGIRDLFDHGVSTNFAGLGSPFYDQTLYDPTGRSFYVKLTQKF